MKTLVIADRDGTLIADRHYLSCPDMVSVLPGVVEAISLFAQSRIDLVVASNQSGVARGLFDESSIHKVNERCISLIDPKGDVLKHFFYCKHSPLDGCSCRKPLSGMVDEFLRQTATIYNRVYVVGDRMCDLELAMNIKAIPIVVQTGKGADTLASSSIDKYRFQFLACDGFLEAANMIVCERVPLFFYD